MDNFIRLYKCPNEICVFFLGSIVKTNDAGATWSDISYNTYDDFNSVFFTDANKGFIVSSSGKIFSTTDGGTHWFVRTSGTSWLNSVTFTDDNTGYAVGYNNIDHVGAIVKTTDGGNSWTYQSSGINAGLYSVSFPDGNTGYISGSNGTILKTTDWGAAWTVLPCATTKNLWSIYFPCADTGYAVDDSGTILKTTNGGIVSIENKEPSTGSFTIYPLPASDKITISNRNKVHEKTMIMIFNIQGEMELYGEFQNQTMVQMDVGILSAGVYLMKIQSKAGVEFKKLVIR